MRKNPNKDAIVEVPAFDETILVPSGNEMVCAVRTMPLHEFKVEEHCRQQGIVSYLPLRKTLKFHNFSQKGRPYAYSREVLRPLFPSYLFLKAAPAVFRELFRNRLIQRFLPPPDQASFLDEIRVVRKCEVVGFSHGLEVHQDIPEGGRFLITSGVWEGVEGILNRRDGLYRWTVRIEFCQQYVTTQIDPTQFKIQPVVS